LNSNKPSLDSYLAIYPETSHLDVLIIDLCGNAIGKRLPRSAMQSMFKTGTPVCGAMQLVDVMGNTADPGGYGFSNGDPDAFARPIDGTLAPIPWLSGNKSQVLCEFVDSVDGKPLWYEPRQILKKMLHQFKETGYTPCLAVELEFYLLDTKRSESGTPLPASSPRTGLPDESGKVL